MGDNTYVVLKLLGSLVAAGAGIIGTLSDLRIDKNGNKVLSWGGYAVLACLILGTLVSMTTDYHKESSDREAAKGLLNKLGNLVNQAGVTNSRLEIANKNLESQVEKSQAISDQLSNTERKVEASSSRVLDPFSTDIKVHVEIWIPNQPRLQPYLRRLAGRSGRIYPDSKLFPDSTLGEESQLSLLADLKVIEVEFPNFRAQGFPRLKFYAHCNPHNTGSARPIDKYITALNSSVEGPIAGLNLECSTSDVEWYQLLSLEVRSFQDLSGKKVVVGVNLVPPDRGHDLKMYWEGDFQLDYEVLTVTATASVGRGFSLYRLRKQPCEKPYEKLPCFVGTASAT